MFNPLADSGGAAVADSEPKKREATFMGETLEHSIVNKAFEGVELPTSVFRRAVLVLGPEGSGKTMHGQRGFNDLVRDADLRKTFVTVSLDNILPNLPGFESETRKLRAEWHRLAKDPEPGSTGEMQLLFSDLCHLREEARGEAGGDRIRKMVFDRAFDKGYNQLIVMNQGDTTLNKDAPHEPEIVRTLKSRHMHVDALFYLAPAKMAWRRMCSGEARKELHPDAALEDRLKSYEALPGLIQKADSVRIMVSDDDRTPPRQTLVWEDGKLVTESKAAQEAFLRIVERDKSYFRTHHFAVDTVERLDAVERAVRETFRTPSNQTTVQAAVDRLHSEHSTEHSGAVR